MKTFNVSPKGLPTLTRDFVAANAEDAALRYASYWYCRWRKGSPSVDFSLCVFDCENTVGHDYETFNVRVEKTGKIILLSSIPPVNKVASISA